MAEASLAGLSVIEIAKKAQKLVRMGQISGEAAICLIVWPQQADMIRYLEHERENRPLDVQIAA